MPPNFIDGNIDIHAGLFPIDQARNLDTWHVTGIRTTGSNDYEFANVTVPVGVDVPVDAAAPADPRAVTRTSRSRCGPRSGTGWPPAPSARRGTRSIGSSNWQS